MRWGSRRFFNIHTLISYILTFTVEKIVSTIPRYREGYPNVYLVTLTRGSSPHTIAGWKRNIVLSCSGTTKCRRSLNKPLQALTSLNKPFTLNISFTAQFDTLRLSELHECWFTHPLISTDFPCCACECDWACVFCYAGQQYAFYYPYGTAGYSLLQYSLEYFHQWQTKHIWHYKHTCTNTFRKQHIHGRFRCLMTRFYIVWRIPSQVLTLQSANKTIFHGDFFSATWLTTFTNA